MLRYVMPIKRIREQRVSAHLLIYSFFIFQIIVRVWVRINVMAKARVRVWVRFRVGVRAKIGIFLFLHNVPAASVIYLSYSGIFFSIFYIGSTYRRSRVYCVAKCTIDFLLVDWKLTILSYFICGLFVLQ